jgi:hypothetical protein
MLEPFKVDGWPPYEYFADFELFSADWDGDEECDVEIVHMLGGEEADYCLVIWRYGKAIPGTGLDRVTAHGHAIYQRIGVGKVQSSLRLLWLMHDFGLGENEQVHNSFGIVYSLLSCAC